MSNSGSQEGAAQPTREQFMSALFANLVFQNTNMALMFLGRAPNPETGENITDVEAAKMFIDQLEMLEFKTKGNLSKDEERLLQQSLTHLRLSFVDVVENAAKQPAAEPAKAADAASATPAPDAAAEEESRKKFSKKY